MRRIAAVIAVVAIALAGAWGVIVLGSASYGGCPAALLDGTLEADGTTHDLVVRTDDGQVMTVTWPIGYAVGAGGDGQPVLTRVLIEVARPGDRVAIGGGEGQQTDFAGCGVIEVTPGGT